MIANLDKIKLLVTSCVNESLAALDNVIHKAYVKTTRSNASQLFQGIFLKVNEWGGE